MNILDDDRFYWGLGIITLLLGVALDAYLGSPIRSQIFPNDIRFLITFLLTAPLLIITFVFSIKKYSLPRSILHVFIAHFVILILLSIPVIGRFLGLAIPLAWLYLVYMAIKGLFNRFTKQVASAVVRQQNAQSGETERHI